MWSAVQGFQDGESELMQILSCHGIPSDDDYQTAKPMHSGQLTEMICTTNLENIFDIIIVITYIIEHVKTANFNEHALEFSFSMQLIQDYSKRQLDIMPCG